jgi:hypothetical protein
MNNNIKIPFDRVTYKDGQRLATRDMEDDRRREAWLRRLHMNLHDTWGIALGFEVDKTDDGRGVSLKPGYAVDDLGRDIFQAEAIQLPVPAVVGPERYVLTLSYQEDAAFRERNELKNVCLGSGLDPRLERPLLKWRRPDDVRFGPHVPVVQILIENGTIQGELDSRVRRNARPWVRPHIGFGATERGRSGWREWVDGDDQQLGLELAVDASEAGFTKTPFYFATLYGDMLTETGDSSSGGMPKNSMFLDGLRFVTDVRQDGFIYRIIRTDQFPAGELPSAAEAEEREWFISWFGLEPVTGCEAPVPLFFFLASGFQFPSTFQLQTNGA